MMDPPSTPPDEVPASAFDVLPPVPIGAPPAPNAALPVPNAQSPAPIIGAPPASIALPPTPEPAPPLPGRRTQRCDAQVSPPLQAPSPSHGHPSSPALH